MARTIASLIVLIGSLTAPCTCITWTGGPPPNGSLQECLGNNVSLDWDFLTSTEDTVLSIQWLFTNAIHRDPKLVATANSGSLLQSSGTKTRMEFLPMAGLRLYNVSTQDLGTYTVHITLFHKWNFISQHRSVTISLPDSPFISSGRLRAWLVSGTITARRSSHVRLACGTINNHRYAKFSITWTTPSGRSLPSTSHADGVFYLTLDNPVAGGPYSCQLQGITALSCLRNDSQDTMAVVDVDALGARMLVLEDSARRHDRDLELQEREADVVSQSINNITVNLRVVDELTEEMSERVDNLCTHVQVTDNVTTETAQRIDKVTRNVEDQRETQSRMKESLNGVIEKLTNHSGRVTNLALSVDDLKSDTEKLSESVDSLTSDTKTLSGSVDSLTSDTKTLSGYVDRLKSDTETLNRSLDSVTSELHATTDVQRNQIEAMTIQGEKQHADMVELLQKTNNLTSLAERQEEELIQQKQTISELSTVIDTQSEKMAQQRVTITSLMSNLTSVMDILGNITSSTFYKDLEVRPSSCLDVKKYSATSGVHYLYVSGRDVRVYCDQETGDGGWTVIQRRQDGSVDFYRGWQEYVNGFGFAGGEYWIGLDNIYHMTRTARFTLRVDLTAFDGTTAYAEYTQFSIGGAGKNYTLHVSGYSGNAGNSMANHNMPFTTHDRDNDRSNSSNCAAVWHGAWWYSGCHDSNLNGRYKTSAVTGGDGIGWWYWKNSTVSLKKTEMKLRPVV